MFTQKHQGLLLNIDSMKKWFAKRECSSENKAVLCFDFFFRPKTFLFSFHINQSVRPVAFFIWHFLEGVEISCPITVKQLMLWKQIWVWSSQCVLEELLSCWTKSSSCVKDKTLKRQKSAVLSALARSSPKLQKSRFLSLLVVLLYALLFSFALVIKYLCIKLD